MFKNNRTFIIAEARINHNGSEKIAKQLIETAYNCRADAIKFQTYVTKNLVTKNAQLADNQKNDLNFKNQFEMLKKYELSEGVYKKLKKNKKISFFNKLSWQDGLEWVFFIKINKKINNKLILFFKKNRILINKFWIPLHTQKPYKTYKKENLIFTNFIWDKILVLPSYPGLKFFEQMKIINKINQFFK